MTWYNGDRNPTIPLKVTFGLGVRIVSRRYGEKESVICRLDSRPGQLGWKVCLRSRPVKEGRGPNERINSITMENGPIPLLEMKVRMGECVRQKVYHWSYLYIYTK